MKKNCVSCHPSSIQKLFATFFLTSNFAYPIARDMIKNVCYAASILQLDKRIRSELQKVLIPSLKPPIEAPYYEALGFRQSQVINDCLTPIFYRPVIPGKQAIAVIFYSEEDYIPGTTTLRQRSALEGICYRAYNIVVIPVPPNLQKKKAHPDEMTRCIIATLVN
ncbi:MAG: hypothetical protein MRY21_05940 [Simkaniaceae bacterium]|nr:hypothetical protein [Simkaniaceae bacterium]